MYKVMIVDDEILVRVGLKSMINWQEIGFEIIGEAGNGEAAYEKFVALQPDVVISDIKMPKKDGLWLAKKIKEKKPDTEIILLTCYDDFDYAREALKLHVSDYLLKAEMEEQEIQELMIEKREQLKKSSRHAGEKEQVSERKQKEMLLGMLVDQKYSNDEIRCAFIRNGYKWNQHGYCFLQIDFSSSLDERTYSKEQISHIVTACMEVVLNYFSETKAACLIKQFGKSIMCFLMDEDLAERKLRADMERIRESVFQYFNLDFKSAGSKAVDTVEAAREQVAAFYELSDHLFYTVNGTHVSQEQDSDRKKGRVIISEDYRKEISRQIENGDSDAVKHSWNKLKERLIKGKEPSMNVKLVLSHLCADLIKRFEVFITEESQLYHYPEQVIMGEEMEQVFFVLEEFSNGLIHEILSAKIGNSDILIDKAVRYIEEHYAERIALEDIASHVGISKYYFSNLFKKEKGINFSSFLNAARIEKAKELLKKPGITIGEVYSQVGFNDPQYFAKTFKKYTKMTVTEYRSRKIIH